MIGVEVDRDSLRRATRELTAASDGKRLRREMAAVMRRALDPAVAEARAAVMSIPSARSGSPPLRAGIAARIRAEVRLSGRSTGARVRARRTPHIRGFDHAPKRTQSRRGWRRPAFGSETWVTQRGRVRWFDDAVKRRAGESRAAVKAVLDDFARRLADRIGR